MKLTTCISNYIRKIDIFGVNLTFSYSKIKYHKTLFGSLFTILLFSLFIFKLIISIKGIILKENLDFRIEEIPVRNDYIELKNLEVAICPIYSIKYNDTTFNKYYKINSVIMDEFSNQILQNLTITNSECHTESSFNFLNNFSCLCLKFDKKDSIQIGKNSKILHDSFMKLELSMNFTLTEKQEIEKYKNHIEDIKKMILIYPKNYINVSDYYNPIGTEYDTIDISFNNNSRNDILIETKKLKVDIVNDIYTLGLFNPERLSTFTYEISQKSSNILSNIYEDNFSRINIIFKHSGVLKIYSIYSVSIENFLSKFGGIVQIFFLLFNLISTIFNNSSFKKYINKRFETKMKNIPKLINNIELYISNKKVNNNIIHNPKNAFEDFINLPQDDLKSVFSSKTKNFNYENENENNILNELKNKFGTKIEMKKSEYNFIITTNTKMKNSNNKKMLNLNYRDNLIDDFNSILDYEKYYEIVKELKLIKYFLLDGENVKWINKFQNIPFNIEKFEEFIIEESEGINSQMKFNFENIDSFYSKLNRLKDFMQNVVY